MKTSNDQKKTANSDATDKAERTILYAAERVEEVDGVNINLYFNTGAADEIVNDPDTAIIEKANKEDIKGYKDINNSLSIVSELYKLVEYLPVLKQAILDKKININEKIPQRGAASFVSAFVQLFKSTGNTKLPGLFNFLLDNNADLESAFSIEEDEAQRKPLIRYIYDESFSNQNPDIMQKLLLEIIKHDNSRNTLLKHLNSEEQGELLAFGYQQLNYLTNMLNVFVNEVKDSAIQYSLNRLLDNQNLGAIDIILTKKHNIYKSLVDNVFANKLPQVGQYLMDNSAKFHDTDFKIMIDSASKYKNAISAQLIEYLMKNNGDVIKENWAAALEIASNCKMKK